MAERKLTKRKDEARRVAQLVSGSSAPSEVLPENLGTTSVRGTWPSEGEAGRHLPLQAASAEGTSRPESILQRLERIAEQARTYPEMQFTTLAHLVDVAMLERAFWKLNPRSSPGIDRMTWQAYKRDLETHLEDLHQRLVSGTYVPQAVVRRWIPKSPGKFRPLGIPTVSENCTCPQRGLGIDEDYASLSSVARAAVPHSQSKTCCRR